ncbi:MAG: phosphorylcholine transferase LicD [Ruminococcus sp.]
MSNYLEKSKKYKGYHFTELKPEMLDYLHRKTIEMLKIIIPIFEASNIRYMICGGTLLGAVTTGKFIPWDDDVDICVLEEDYDKMIDVLIENLPSWIEMQWTSTEPNYYHGWVKVRDKNSHVYPDTDCYSCNGVWIDLYKLTLIKNKEVQYLIAKEHLDYLNRRYNVGDISLEERNIRINDNKLNEILQRELDLIKKNPDETQVYVIWSASKIIINKNWCMPLKKYDFEGLELYSFSDADAYLTRHYGNDYKTLPPYEMRRVGINRIDIFD